MIRVSFGEEEVKQLRKERFDHPHPRVQLKMEVLLLKSQGLAHHQITAIAGIAESTLCQYLHEYQAGGIQRLKEVHFYRTQSVLQEHRGTLEAYFLEHPPATVKEAAAKIEQITGIGRGLTQVRHFLKSLGLRRLKVGSLPAKADPEQQEQFKKKSWSLV
jgi:transposase